MVRPCSPWASVRPGPLGGVRFLSRLCHARVLANSGSKRRVSCNKKNGALLTNYLDDDLEYRDLLHTLIDDKPGARAALAQFHNRRADAAELELASRASAFGGDPQGGTTLVNAP